VAVSVNDMMLDRVVSMAVDRAQYSLTTARRMVRLLNRSDARLVAEIAVALDQVDADSFRVARLESLLGSVRAVNARAYADVAAALRGEVETFAAYEASANVELLARGLPPGIGFRVASVAAAQVQAAALARPFQGALLAEWSAKVEADRMAYIRNAIRAGFVEGQTVAQIVRDIRGTRARQYQDGVLQRPRREIEAVADTAIKHTAAVARRMVTEANLDLVKAERWVSTLDGVTSEPCRLRDGLQYEPVTHKPIGHKVPWGAGPGRLHFRCRSVSVPVLKSWRELGIEANDVPPGTRASMTGQVPSDLTYRDWLKQQSASRQEEILGPTRAALIRRGGLELPDLYTTTGVPLTLAQLAERDRRAFERAGVSP
jgi:hypothetical protein